MFNVETVQDATYSFVHLTGTGSIATVQVGPNALRAAAVDRRWKSILHNSGAGARARIGLSGNVGTYVQNPWTTETGGFAPEAGENVVLAAASLTRRTHAVGTEFFSGDGVTTSFQIALPTQGPSLRAFSVTPTTPLAAAQHHVTTGGSVPAGFSSEITVVFASPPPAGPNNVFRWEAWT